MKAKIKLNIADTIVEMQSRFKMETVADKKMKERVAMRIKNFLYNGGRKPDVKIKVELVDKLPDAQKAKRVFITHHFQSGRENWRLLKRGNLYIYECLVNDQRQLILLDRLSIGRHHERLKC